MRKILISFCSIIMVSAASQNRPIEMVFDSISTDNSRQNERVFNLHFHIKNNSENEIAFILDTKSMVPVVSSSSSPAPHYKLFKDGKSVDAAQIFSFGRISERDFKNQEEYRIYTDSLRLAYASKSTAEWEKDRDEFLMKRLQKIEPGKSLVLIYPLEWDLQRYQKQDENEYFLDASASYELELSMHLMREEFKTFVSEKAFETLCAIPNLISGWYTSNRLKIDLSD